MNYGQLLLTPLLLLGAADAVAIDGTFECLIEPMVITDVGSPVQGVIETLKVDRSDLVQRGQVLAELKSDVERATFEQTGARARMKSEIAARRADLELAQHNMRRMEELQSQKMVPTQQVDEARAQLSVAKAAQTQALENYKLLQHELKRATEVLNQRSIRSPVDGVVVEQKAFPGEFVYENAVMTIAQLDPLRVEVVLPARYFGQLRPGDAAVIHPEIGTAEPLTAEIDVIDRLLDTRSGTFGVRLVLPNPDLAIPGGQNCQLEFSPDSDRLARR